MFTKYKQKIQPLVAIISQPFLSWNPHMLTLMSLVFAILFIASLSLHNYVLAGISWVGVIFDAIDGYVARKTGRMSAFGAFFDSTIDRISDFLYISAFGFAGLIAWPLIVVGLLVTFLISYTKARGESLLPNITINEGIMQRSERLLAISAIFIAFLISMDQVAVALFCLLILLNIVTIWQRVVTLRNQL